MGTINTKLNGKSPKKSSKTSSIIRPSGLADKKVVIGLQNYAARATDEVSFKAGDKMEIIDSSDRDWPMVRNVTSGKEGYVPAHLITEDENAIEKQEWWFGGDRREAEKQLMLPGNPRGTFLARKSADKRVFALSVRDFNDTTNEVTVRHYKVKVDQETGTCHIAATNSFDSLVDLVEFYKKSANGLCCRLIKACPREAICVPFRELEVNRKEIELLTKLGQGQFGEVWKGKWRRQVDVAVKTMKFGSMSVDDFIEEARRMHTLRHRRLVQIMGVCTDASPVYIITELMANGSLHGYLRADDGRKVDLPAMVDMVNDVTQGLAFLETRNVVHRDIRAANILVADNASCKVADFGLAKILDEEMIYTIDEDAKFPVKWTSPEAIASRKFSSKSDVWSFGILLYEIVTYGRDPYPGMSNSTSSDKVSSGYRMPRPVNCGHAAKFSCPAVIYDVMLKCWDIKPANRPTFEYLNNFFENYTAEAERQYTEKW